MNKVELRVPRRAVYTAVFGNYEDIVEQPTANTSDVRFICFTDDATAKSDTWEIQVLTERVQDDPTRSARQLKILGHEMLREFDETLWIDNRVLLKVKPEDLLDVWLRNQEMALPKHSYRGSVREEFQVVLASGLDDPYKVREQRSAYEQLAPNVLDAQPYWTAILARRRTDRVGKAMRIWMDNVLRYSKRDQLSVNYALHRSGVDAQMVEIDNFESDWHRWIHTKELPKNRAVRYWRHHGFRYHWWLRLSDGIRSSRAFRALAAKMRLDDRKYVRK